MAGRTELPCSTPACTKLRKSPVPIFCKVQRVPQSNVKQCKLWLKQAYLQPICCGTASCALLLLVSEDFHLHDALHP